MFDFNLNALKKAPLILYPYDDKGYYSDRYFIKSDVESVAKAMLYFKDKSSSMMITDILDLGVISTDETSISVLSLGNVSFTQDELVNALKTVVIPTDISEFEAENEEEY